MELAQLLVQLACKMVLVGRGAVDELLLLLRIGDDDAGTLRLYQLRLAPIYVLSEGRLGGSRVDTPIILFLVLRRRPLLRSRPAEVRASGDAIVTAQYVLASSVALAVLAWR